MTMSRTMLADEESKAKMDASRHAKPEPISEWDIVRLTQVFKSFDSNNSGCVVVGVIPLLCRVRGITLACPAPSTISRDEFKHALDEASEMGMKLTIPHDSEVMDRYFAAMDTDGDEQVGIKEFLAVRCGRAYALRTLLSLAFPYVPVPTHPHRRCKVSFTTPTASCWNRCGSVRCCLRKRRSAPSTCSSKPPPSRCAAPSAV